jgi:hypothetical protein
MNERKRIYHADGSTCPVCDGPLDADRDAICHVCSPDSEFEAQMDAAEAMSDLVAALQARAEGIPGLWCDFSSNEYHFSLIGKGTRPWAFTGWKDEPDSVSITATLLGALDPDAVVVDIRQFDDDANNEKICDNFCALVPSRCSMSHPSFNLRGERSPNELCPGPCDDDHEYVLVKRRKVTRPPCAGCGEPSDGLHGTTPTCKQCHDNYVEGHEEMDKLMKENPYDG